MEPSHTLSLGKDTLRSLNDATATGPAQIENDTLGPCTVMEGTKKVLTRYPGSIGSANFCSATPGVPPAPCPTPHPPFSDQLGGWGPVLTNVRKGGGGDLFFVLWGGTPPLLQKRRPPPFVREGVGSPPVPSDAPYEAHLLGLESEGGSPPSISGRGRVGVPARSNNGRGEGVTIFLEDTHPLM